MAISETKKPNKPVNLGTYIFAVLCLLAGLFVPLFDGNGILALQLPDVFNIISGNELLSFGKQFTLNYPVNLLGFGVSVDFMAWAVLLYAVITVLGLLAFIPVIISTLRNGKVAVIFMYIVEIAAAAVLTIYVLIALILYPASGISYNMVIAIGGSVLALIILGFLNKGVAGVPKFFLFLLSAVGIIALYDIAVLVPQVASINFGTAFYGANEQQITGMSFLVSVAGNKFSDVWGLYSTAADRTVFILGTVLSAVVVLNFFIDLIGLASNAKATGYIFNLARYLLELLAAACLLITLAVAHYSMGLMLIVLAAVALIQLFINVGRYVLYRKKKNSYTPPPVTVNDDYEENESVPEDDLKEFVTPEEPRVTEKKVDLFDSYQMFDSDGNLPEQEKDVTEDTYGEVTSEQDGETDNAEVPVAEPVLMNDEELPEEVPSVSEEISENEEVSPVSEEIAETEPEEVPSVSEEIAETEPEEVPSVSEEIAETESEEVPSVSEEIAETESEEVPSVSEEIAETESEEVPSVSEEIAETESEEVPSVSEEIAETESEEVPSVSEEIAVQETPAETAEVETEEPAPEPVAEPATEEVAQESAEDILNTQTEAEAQATEEPAHIDYSALQAIPIPEPVAEQVAEPVAKPVVEHKPEPAEPVIEHKPEIPENYRPEPNYNIKPETYVQPKVQPAPAPVQPVKPVVKEPLKAQPIHPVQPVQPEQPRIYTINTIYGGPTDDFINKLTNDERIEFAMTFIERSRGPVGNIPEYKIGGNNKSFFSAVFIYLGRIRGLISDDLLNKMYKELNMM